MKKSIVLSFVLLFALCGAAFAAEQSASVKNEIKPEDQAWEFISLSFFPGFSTSPDFVNVYGVRLGIPVAFGDFSTVTGLEASMLVSMTKNVNGIQASPFLNTAGRVDGVQASTIANNAKTVNGIQLGLVNIASEKSFQIGLVNIIKDSCLPFMILINFRF